MRQLFLLLSFLSLSSVLAQSRTISKAREDFADEKFTQGLERLASLSKDAPDQALFNFYKSFYYTIPNNPAYTLDSAYVCVVRSEQLYNGLNEKERTRLCADFLLCESRFMALKDSISNEIYSDLVRRKDLLGLEKFVLIFSNSNAYPLAIQKIEYFKFERATAANDLNLLDNFLKEYPKSSYLAVVNTLREKLRYEQAIQINALTSYQQFLLDFPNATYKQDIQNRLETLVYNNAKAAHSLGIYNEFLTQFPSSKYRTEIDTLIYSLRFDAVLLQKDIAAITLLLNDYPFGSRNAQLEQLLDDLYYEKAIVEPSLANIEMYCKKFQSNGIRYAELAPKLEKMRYENAVSNSTKESWMQFISDFPNSMMLAEAKIALGELFTILPYLKANGRMEYRDLQTQTPQFGKEFDWINPFENGRAIVRENRYSGLIDDKGRFLIKPVYDEIQTAFDANLVIASRIKLVLSDYWSKNTDAIYNNAWSSNDLTSLKNYLSTASTYKAKNQAALQAYRRYLGAMITNKYYSFEDFSYYGENTDKFSVLKEKAIEEFDQKEHTLYLFVNGPFASLNVLSFEVYEASNSNEQTPYFTYELGGNSYQVVYKNGIFQQRGTESKRIIFETPEVKIIREGFLETDDNYNPGNFYLETSTGEKLTKQEFNAMEPLGADSKYFLCHQGGTYENYKGWLWEIVGGKWGLINKTGQIILPFIFDNLQAVDSIDIYPYLIATINKVYPTEDNDYKETIGNVSLIDLQGKEIIPYSDGYNQIKFVNSNTIIVTKNAVIGYYADSGTEGVFTLGGTAGVVDIARNTILPVVYNEIQPINNNQQFVVRKGMKLVASKEYSYEYIQVGGKYSLVNRSNQFLLPNPIDYLNTNLVGCIGCSVSMFDEAFNGKWGVINELGKTIIPFNYSFASASSLPGVYVINSGLIYKKNYGWYEVAAEGKYGLARNGTLMTALKYDNIYIYQDYIEAPLGKQTDYYQPNGQPLSFKCDAIDKIEGQIEGKTAFLAYRIGAKWGLMNNKFKKITEADFWGEIDGEQNQHPFTFDKGLFLVDQGGLKFYITRKGLILKDAIE